MVKSLFLYLKYEDSFIFFSGCIDSIDGSVDDGCFRPGAGRVGFDNTDAKIGTGSPAMRNTGPKELWDGSSVDRLSFALFQVINVHMCCIGVEHSMPDDLPRGRVDIAQFHLPRPCTRQVSSLGVDSWR
jgi:hypothetical protein